jgi:hypothetical protein
MAGENDAGAGDGDKGAEGGGKEKTVIAPSHDEATPADKGKEQPKKVADRPEWVPENFWDKDKGEADYEGMAKSWGDLRKKVSMRSDDLAKTLKEDLEKERLGKRPESADKYELRLPKDVPEDAWEWNDKDPLLAYARDLAFNTGMGQDEFDKLVGTYVESELARLPDIEAETKRLGEKGKERLERMDNWLAANVSKGAYAALSSAATKAEVIVALEEMMVKAGAPAFVVDSDVHGNQDVLSDAQVRTWMADPKYWDPAKRDAKFVEKVETAWKKLYPSTAGGGPRR